MPLQKSSTASTFSCSIASNSVLTSGEAIPKRDRIAPLSLAAVPTDWTPASRSAANLAKSGQGCSPIGTRLIADGAGVDQPLVPIRRQHQARAFWHGIDGFGKGIFVIVGRSDTRSGFGIQQQGRMPQAGPGIQETGDLVASQDWTGVRGKTMRAQQNEFSCRHLERFMTRAAQKQRRSNGYLAGSEGTVA